MVLTKTDVINYLSKPEKEYSQQLISKVEKAYDIIKYQEINKNKTKEELFATLDSIAFNLEQGGYRTAEGASREYSDNKHMNYFDNFGEEGLSYQITEALAKKNIGTDVLKGVKSFEDNYIEIKDKGVNISINWSNQGEDSKTISNIIIYDDKYIDKHKKLVDKIISGKYSEKQINKLKKDLDKHILFEWERW